MKRFAKKMNHTIEIILDRKHRQSDKLIWALYSPLSTHASNPQWRYPMNQRWNIYNQISKLLESVYQKRPEKLISSIYCRHHVFEEKNTNQGAAFNSLYMAFAMNKWLVQDKKTLNYSQNLHHATSFIIFEAAYIVPYVVSLWGSLDVRFVTNNE